MKTYTNNANPGKKPKLGKAKKTPITNETLAEDRQRAKSTRDVIIGGEGKTYEGSAAPRVGGKVDKSDIPVPQGAPTVRLMKQSKKRAKHSMASPQAKKAAIRALKNRY